MRKIHREAADEVVSIVAETIENIRSRPAMSYRSPSEAQACGAQILFVLARLLDLPWEAAHNAVRPVLCDENSVNVVDAKDWQDAADRISRGLCALKRVWIQRDEELIATGDGLVQPLTPSADALRTLGHDPEP